jgi:hypothetical protein
MKLFRSIILTVFLSLSFQAMAGGGWTKDKGTGFYKLGQWWIISDEHYTNTGRIDPNGTRATFLTSFYGEYGLTDRITGIIYLPFFARSLIYEQVSETNGSIITEGEAINSIGDVDLSIKYGLIRNKPIVLSATLTLGLPLGEDAGGSDGSLQTGDGEFNQMITIDASRSFKLGNYYPYLSVNSGINNRTQGFSDEFRYGVESGITMSKFTVIARLYGIKSFKNGDTNFNSSGTSIFANNAEYLVLSPEIAYNFTEKVGISATYFHTLSGKLIFSKPAYSVGVFLIM